VWFSANASVHLTATEVEAGVTAAMTENNVVSDVAVSVEQSLQVEVSMSNAPAPQVFYEPLRETFCPGHPARCTVNASQATTGSRRNRALSAAGITFEVTRTLVGNDSLAAPIVLPSVLASHLSHSNASDLSLVSTVLGNTARVVATQSMSGSTLAAVLTTVSALPVRLASILNVPSGGIQIYDIAQAMVPPPAPPALPSSLTPAVESPPPSAPPSQAGQIGAPSAPSLQVNLPPSLPPAAVVAPAGATANTAQGGSNNSTTTVVIGVAAGCLVLVGAVLLLMYRRRKAAESQLKPRTVRVVREEVDSTDVVVHEMVPGGADGTTSTTAPSLLDVRIITNEKRPAELTPDASEQPTEAAKSVSSAGGAALQRARANKKDGEAADGSRRATRTTSWGRVATRRRPSAIRRDSKDEPDVQYQSHEGVKGVQLPSMSAVEGLEKQLSGDPKPLTPRRPESGQVALSVGDARLESSDAKPDAAPQSETLTSPSDSMSPPESASAPASTPPSTERLDMDAVRERIDAHKNATREKGLVLSSSAGSLPHYLSTDDQKRSTTSTSKEAEDTGDLRRCVSADSPLRHQKSPRSSTAAAPAPASLFAGSPAVAPSAAPPRKLSITQQMAQQFEETFAPAPAAQQSSGVQIPRLSMDEESWPPASAPAAARRV